MLITDVKEGETIRLAFSDGRTGSIHVIDGPARLGIDLPKDVEVFVDSECRAEVEKQRQARLTENV